MEKLLLFDIDGTLMEESPTHTYSFNYVCERIYGVKTDIESFPRHGMTDTGILYGLLKKQNIPEIEIKNKINEAFRTMEEYVSSNIKPADYALLNNVDHVLETLKEKKYVLGILTGNIQPVASIRIKKAGIEKYFATGGYGSDDIIRSKLVDYAMERYGRSIQKSGIYLIGDTPLDIKAAREASVNAIGVATGMYDINDLKSADLVIENLTDENKLLEYLKN